MKRALLLSILMLTVALQSAFAYQETTRLQISSYDNAPIKVIIDGEEYGQFSNRQKLANLSPGFHNVRIFASYPGRHQAFPIARMIYNGKVNILEGVAIEAVVRPGNKLQIVEQVAIYTPAPQGPAVCGPTTYPFPPQYDPTPVPTGPIAMCEPEFHDFLYSVQSKSFESTRLTIARQVISQNYFTSAQVRQLMGVFTFESGRMEIAKFAYSHVVDPNRYYIVNDAFTFESSISELNQYLYN